MATIATAMMMAMILGVTAGAARAEVTFRTPGGFVSEHELEMAGSPGRVYQALTRDVHLWWDPSHSYSGQARNFYLEARAMGCFCEHLESGGSVAHMQVVFAQPGRRLRMIGGLGPLQALGVSGSMDFELSPEDGHTRLRYRYAVSGTTPGGLDRLAEPVDRVQLGQLERLQAFLAEDGG